MELIIKHYSELTLDELYDILKARTDIFVVEQNCPYHELDGKDKDAFHVFLRGGNGIIAYLRTLDRGVAFDEVSLGRIITVRRGQGFGEKIMRAGIEFAKKQYGADKIKIMAQCQAKGFYEKFGFKQCSEPFLDDGIMHIDMLAVIRE